MWTKITVAKKPHFMPARSIAAVPILHQRLKDEGYNEVTATGMALVISAGIFGGASAPGNRARIMMQDKLEASETRTKRYAPLIKSMWHEASNISLAKRTLRFFQGGAPRTVTSALAGGLYFKGSELYDEAVKWSHDMESKKF